MKQSYDFTAGPIGRPLLLYTLPLLLANVLQSFYQPVSYTHLTLPTIA